MAFGIGLMLGAALGWIAMGETIRYLFVSGRLTARQIAAQCDRLLDAGDEPTEPDRPARGPRTL